MDEKTELALLRMTSTWSGEAQRARLGVDRAGRRVALKNHMLGRAEAFESAISAIWSLIGVCQEQSHIGVSLEGTAHPENDGSVE